MPNPYINQYDIRKKAFKLGTSAEEDFRKWLIKNNIKYRDATLEEQYNHIDFIIFYNDEEIKIDVKATKRKGRNDKNLCFDKLWVEFKNGEGNPGWLYGLSDFIVFEKQDENGFYWIKREELKDLCIKICNQGFTNDKYNALYHIYTRYGRNDKISQIKFDDLLALNYVFIDKVKD